MQRSEMIPVDFTKRARQSLGSRNSPTSWPPTTNEIRHTVQRLYAGKFSWPRNLLAVLPDRRPWDLVLAGQLHAPQADPDNIGAGQYPEGLPDAKLIVLADRQHRATLTLRLAHTQASRVLVDLPHPEHNDAGLLELLAANGRRLEVLFDIDEDPRPDGFAELLASGRITITRRASDRARPAR